MKIIAVIPARYASTRFPQKMLKDLAGEPLIVRTYEAVQRTGLFDKVIVATDAQAIKDVVEHVGGTVYMSKQEHESGSDRIAEAIADEATDIVVNIQGDEPFVSVDNLKALIDAFQEDTAKEIAVSSIMIPMKKADEINNPNNVKVVVDNDNFALYFSRAAIPFNRDKNIKVTYYKHIGVYAFRKEALIAFSKMPKGVLEQIEMLEQLRYLENGKKIKMIKTQGVGLGIDTPEDLEKANEIWHECF